MSNEIVSDICRLILETSRFRHPELRRISRASTLGAGTLQSHLDS